MPDAQDHALFWELHDLLESVIDQRDQQSREELRLTLPNHPGLVVSGLLYDDAIGEFPLPDETVSRLWDIGYALGYDRDFLVSEAVVAKARPERRTRPPQKLRRPLSGGGHGPGRSIPGKREFPLRWDDDTTIGHTMDVAKHPSGGTLLPDGAYRFWGERDGVLLAVLVSQEGDVLTSYPVTGDGVVQHQLDQARAPYVAALQTVLDHVVAVSDDEPRRSLDELLAVGEWPHVVASLAALGAEGPELQSLREAAGP